MTNLYFKAKNIKLKSWGSFDFYFFKKNTSKVIKSILHANTFFFKKKNFIPQHLISFKFYVKFDLYFFV